MLRGVLCEYARFQAFPSKQMRTALTWAIAQCAVLLYHRRFGTTYQFHINGTDQL